MSRANAQFLYDDLSNLKISIYPKGGQYIYKVEYFNINDTSDLLEYSKLNSLSDVAGKFQDAVNYYISHTKVKEWKIWGDNYD